MGDGSLLVAGGSRFYTPPGCGNAIAAGIPYKYLFDPIAKIWNFAGEKQNPHKMDDGRFYPTVTILGDDPQSNWPPGSIIAMSGTRTEGVNCESVVNKDPEIYHPINGWSLMDNQSLAEQPFDDLYTGAHLVPFGDYAGKVFYSMPMDQAWMFNPFADGIENPYWEEIGSKKDHRHDGSSVLLPLLPGLTSSNVMVIGGGEPGTNTVDIIDLADSSPDWTGALNMFHGRRNPNVVILPDDKILVIGGNSEEQLVGPIFTAEQYDIDNGEWTLLPAMNRPRLYHSVGILLPNGRVWVAGTDWPPISERNIEIYSPGYLFEGERPEITNAPNNITYDTPFGIVTSTPISAIRLIRLSSITHSINFEQRSVGLSFQSGTPNGLYPWSVAAPANANTAPPGYYMLFVLRPKTASLSGETMIPSVAKIVKVSY
jgi:hypothetical protein